MSFLGGTADEEVAALLGADASSYTWAAATVGSQTAATYQLATGESVMPIGGFNGSDPSPTLEEFQQYVAQRRIHYFIDGGMGGRPGLQRNGGSDSGAAIAEWVAATFEARTVGGVTVYDLTAGTAADSSSVGSTDA
jgi:hypothetical protein